MPYGFSLSALESALLPFLLGQTGLLHVARGIVTPGLESTFFTLVIQGSQVSPYNLYKAWGRTLIGQMRAYS